MDLDGVDILLRDWARRRRMDSDVSSVIFGANYTGFSRVNMLDKIRRDAQQKGRRDALDSVPPPPADDPEIMAVDAALARIAECAPIAARAVELRYIQQQGIRDMAKSLSISKSSVFRTLKDAQSRIMQML